MRLPTLMKNVKLASLHIIEKCDQLDLDSITLFEILFLNIYLYKKISFSLTYYYRENYKKRKEEQNEKEVQQNEDVETDLRGEVCDVDIYNPMATESASKKGMRGLSYQTKSINEVIINSKKKIPTALTLRKISQK